MSAQQCVNSESSSAHLCSVSLSHETFIIADDDFLHSRRENCDDDDSGRVYLVGGVIKHWERKRMNDTDGLIILREGDGHRGEINKV